MGRVYKILLFVLIFSCDNNDDISSKWNNCISDYQNKSYDNCLIGLNKIIENHQNSEYAPKAIYMISEIYLNEYKEYQVAKDFLEDILEKYPQSATAKKALFTIAYVNANYIESYTESIEYYEKFLEKYPNDDLVPSVKYELDNLSLLQEKIDSLINVN